MEYGVISLTIKLLFFTLWYWMEDLIKKYELWIRKVGELDVWRIGLNSRHTPKKKKKKKIFHVHVCAFKLIVCCTWTKSWTKIFEEKLNSFLIFSYSFDSIFWSNWFFKKLIIIERKIYVPITTHIRLTFFATYSSYHVLQLALNTYKFYPNFIPVIA